MMIRFVNQNRYIRRNTVQKLAHFLSGHRAASRVVRIAQIDESNFPVVPVRRVDECRNVLSVVVEKWDLDRVGVDAAGVAIDRSIRRFYAHDFLSMIQKGESNYFQNFCGSCTEQNVIPGHAMMLGDRRRDSAIGVVVSH